MRQPQLTESDRNQIVMKALDTLYPSELLELFTDDLRKKWNTYVRSLAPDADESALFTDTLCFSDEDFHLNASSCLWARLPCLDTRTQEVRVPECPDKGLRTTFAAAKDYVLKRNSLGIILRARLASISTMKRLEEEIPEAVPFAGRDETTSPHLLPVCVDIESIAKAADAAIGA